MKKEIVEGTILESLPDTTFKVKIKANNNIEGLPADSVIFAYLAGKMRVNYIKVIPGDDVVIELSPYDKTKGRIIKRK